MSEQPPLSLSVKLRYWDLYRLNVVLTASALRKVLYIWAFVGVLFLSLPILSLVRPASSKHEWAIELENARELEWGFAIPIIFVFGLPLLSAERVLREESIKREVSYQFSEGGVHVETFVSKSDLSWAAIRKIREFSWGFLVFTGPRSVFMLPKTCFDSTQHLAALRELFRAHVKDLKLRSD